MSKTSFKKLIMRLVLTIIEATNFVQVKWKWCSTGVAYPDGYSSLFIKSTLQKWWLQYHVLSLKLHFKIFWSTLKTVESEELFNIHSSYLLENRHCIESNSPPKIYCSMTTILKKHNGHFQVTTVPGRTPFLSIQGTVCVFHATFLWFLFIRDLFCTYFLCHIWCNVTQK